MGHCPHTQRWGGGGGGRTSPPTPADGSSLNIPVRNRPNGSRLNIPVRDRPEDSGLNIPVRNRPNDSRLNIPIRNRRDRSSLHILVRNRRVKARHVLHPQNEILGGGEQVARARLEVCSTRSQTSGRKVDLLSPSQASARFSSSQVGTPVSMPWYCNSMDSTWRGPISRKVSTLAMT